MVYEQCESLLREIRICEECDSSIFVSAVYYLLMLVATQGIYLSIYYGRSVFDEELKMVWLLRRSEARRCVQLVFELVWRSSVAQCLTLTLPSA